MKIISLVAIAGFGLGLSGCSNQYFERKDTVVLNAGDAVAWNSAQQIPNPAPPRSNDTRIIGDGERAARAVQRNIDGGEKWFSDPSDELKDTIIQPPAAAGAAPGGGAPH
jgi:hypothetical protein